MINISIIFHRFHLLKNSKGLLKIFVFYALGDYYKKLIHRDLCQIDERSASGEISLEHSLAL